MPLTPALRAATVSPQEREANGSAAAAFAPIPESILARAAKSTELESSVNPQAGKPALVCPAGVWSGGMKGFLRGLVVPTVAEPPGRLRKEPARKGGRQTFDRRNTNGQ